MSEESFRDTLRLLRIELQILNDRVAAAVGLNPRDLDILDVIDREGPCTPSHLAARTGQKRATITGILARLEKDEWIARDENPRDGRSAHVRSTSRFDELRRLYSPIDGQADGVFGALSEEERGTVRRTLERVIGELRATEVGAPD